MEAKKSLGQHWLEDEASLEAVCNAGLVHRHDTVLEIGPGKGSLTVKLLDRGARVVAIEKDEELVTLLSREINRPGLEIISGDILEFNLNDLPENYKVVANIPYYLTSNLIRVLCESSNSPKIVALLVQKEVAERICADPGQMSLLGVSAQMYFETFLDKIVPAELFAPPPKVDSQIVQLVRRPKPLFEGTIDDKSLFRVVKAGFSTRRKTLLNSLSGGLTLSKEETANLLQIAQINPKVRAQELSLQDWIKLAQIISDSKASAGRGCD